MRKEGDEKEKHMLKRAFLAKNTFRLGQIRQKIRNIVQEIRWSYFNMKKKSMTFHYGYLLLKQITIWHAMRYMD